MPVLLENKVTTDSDIDTNIPDITMNTTNRESFGKMKRGYVQGELLHMHESNPNDIDTIRSSLLKDGYVLCHNVLNREDVIEARRVVLSILDEEWGVVDKNINHTLMDGYIANDAKGITLSGFTKVTHHPNVLRILEGREIFQFFHSLFNGPAETFHNKWVRVQGKDEFTDEHSDYYRFAYLASGGMYVCWVPLGDYRPSDGGLSICEGSHYTVQDDINNGSIMDGKGQDELPIGFLDRANSYPWVGTEYKMGDIVVFDIRCIHSGLPNLSDRFRISFDCRWRKSNNDSNNEHEGGRSSSPFVKEPIEYGLSSSSDNNNNN